MPEADLTFLSNLADPAGLSNVEGIGARHHRVPGLAWRVCTTGSTVTVRLSTPLDLPLEPAGWADTTTVTATGSAIVQVT